MIMGHYVTALIPYAYDSNRKIAPFWLFLLLPQLADFLMLAFVFMGYESISPENFFKVSFMNMQAEMHFSHDILPLALTAVIVSAIVGLLFKSKRLFFIALGLMLLHEVLDMLVGFKHFLSPNHTQAFGLGLYNTMPILGIAFEAIFCILILSWYLRKRERLGYPLKTSAKIILWGTLVGTTIAMTLIAKVPLASLISLQLG